MKPRLRRKRALVAEDGNVLILAALSMTALMGFVALGTDVGLLYRAKRNVQIAADAAAMAGALDYLYHDGSDSGVQQAGLDASSANGFTNGSSGTTVAISTPPAA